MNDYQSLRLRLYGRKKKEKVNPFLEGKVPLGTKERFFSYQYRFDEEDFAWFDINPKNIFTGCLLANPGYGKTTLLKRLLYYFKKKGYQVIVFDPKSDDYSHINKKGVGKKLHPEEHPDSLKVASYVPSFQRAQMNPDDDRLKKYKTTSLPIGDFDSQIHYLTIGLPALAAMGVALAVKSLKKLHGHVDLDTLLITVQSSYQSLNIHPQSVQTIIARIGLLKEAQFFDERYDPINVYEHWDRDEVVNVAFFGGDEKFLSLMAGHMLNDLYHKSFTYKKVPKLIIVDDAHLLASKEMTQSENLSLRNFVNALALWRSAGFNVIFATQSPQLLHPRILEMCKYFIVGRIGAIDYFMDTIGVDRTGGLGKVLQGLRAPEDSFDREWCFIKSDRIHYETFYHMNSIIGHDFGM